MIRGAQRFGAVRVAAIGVSTVVAAAGLDVVTGRVVRHSDEVLRSKIVGIIASERILSSILVPPIGVQSRFGVRADLLAVPSRLRSTELAQLTGSSAGCALKSWNLC